MIWDLEVMSVWMEQLESLAEEVTRETPAGPVCQEMAELDQQDPKETPALMASQDSMDRREIQVCPA